MSTVGFRVDLGPTVGVGHLVRCFALAQVLHELKHSCHFWLTQHSPFVDELFSDYPFSVYEVGVIDEADDAEICMQHVHEQHIDVVVMDHYELDAYWQKKLNSVARLAVLEDLPNRHDKGNYNDSDSAYCIIDPTPQRQSQAYAQAKAKLFLASDYVLVRAGFRQRVATSHGNKQQAYSGEIFQPTNILISFGGSDPQGYSQQVIHELRQGGYRKAIHVVTTSLNPLLPTLQQVAEVNDATLHVDVSDMGQLMASADLMIGAIGSTSWERAVLGLPALSLQVADNQNDVANFFSSIEEHWVTRSAEALFIQLRQWLQLGVAAEQMAARHQNLMQVCDGLGAYRVALRALCVEYHIELQAMHAEHVDLLYQWQCEPNARRFSRQPQIPAYADHVNWFKNSLANTERRMWLIRLGSLDCGYIRLDVLPISAESPLAWEEISILISERVSGMGIARKALEAVKSLSKFGRIHAHVQTENQASQKAFLASGYERVGPTEYQWIAGTEHVE